MHPDAESEIACGGAPKQRPPSPNDRPSLEQSHRLNAHAPNCHALAGLDDAAYHENDRGFSSSQLKKILRSPAHFKVSREQSDMDTPARAFGRAVHARVLEPDLFGAKFCVWNGGARRGTDYAAFLGVVDGRTVLTQEEMLRVDGCAKALRANTSMGIPLQEFLAGVAGEAEALREFSVFWTDEETGLQLKARFDACRAGGDGTIILDIKTTDDARADAFTRQAMKLDYDLSCAMYLEAASQFFGKQSGAFLFAAVEISPPFAVMLYGADKTFLDLGERKFQQAKRTLARCLESGQFPAYAGAESVQCLSAPFWSVMQQDLR